MTDKISLAGDLGSGKSTVSDILIRELGAEYYSTGSIVRSLAARYDMSITDFNAYMETHPEIDNQIDEGIAALSEVDKLLIIDSRMAWHFTKGTFKVYLSTDIETSAIRIMNANRTGEHNATLEDTIAATRRRRQSEQKRYKEQYGVDIKDLSNYSLIVDTTYIAPDRVASVITESFRLWSKNKDSRFCYVAPERLNYIDDAPDAELIGKYSCDIEEGRAVPEVTVFECDGEFYVESGLEAALAYAFNMYDLVPTRLIKGEAGDRKYVKMANSI